jgi:hypothetical protein
MKKKPSSKILIGARIYAYFFFVLLAICLFIPLMTTPHSQFMGSEFIDVLVCCVILSWLGFAYWSLVTALTSQINGSGRYFLEMKQKRSSFILFVVNALGFGLIIGLLTQWALLNFSSGLSDAVVSSIATMNGALYAGFLFSRYFWLAESS